MLVRWAQIPVLKGFSHLGLLDAGTLTALLFIAVRGLAVAFLRSCVSGS